MAVFTDLYPLASARGKQVSMRVKNLYFQRHLAGQRVRGATEAGIISAECHLDTVEHPIRDLHSSPNHAMSGLADRHRNRGMIVRRAHDQVDLAQDAPFVRDVMMVKGPTRRFDATYALRGSGRGNGSYSVAEDLVVPRQLGGPLGGVEQLNDPSPVCGQRLVY